MLVRDLKSNRLHWWVVGIIALVALLLLLRKSRLLLTPQLVPVDVAAVTACTEDSAGMLIPATDPLIVANSETYEPHFPFSDFFRARDYAKSANFRLVVKEKLAAGSYFVSVSNSLGTVVLPLEKKSPELYVSGPLLILEGRANTTYFFGYGVLRQGAGTADTLNIQVEKESHATK